MVEGINILSHKRSLKLSVTFLQLNCFSALNFTTCLWWSVWCRPLCWTSAPCKRRGNCRTSSSTLNPSGKNASENITYRNYNVRLSYFTKWSKSYHKLSGVRSFELELKMKYNYEKLFQVWQALKNHTIKSLSKSVRHEKAVQEIQDMVKRKYLHKMIHKFNQRRTMQS